MWMSQMHLEDVHAGACRRLRRSLSWRIGEEEHFYANSNKDNYHDSDQVMRPHCHLPWWNVARSARRSSRAPHCHDSAIIEFECEVHHTCPQDFATAGLCKNPSAPFSARGRRQARCTGRDRTREEICSMAY